MYAPSTSSINSASRKPLRKQIFLVGPVKPQITGSKLPSNGDVLKVLFYNLRFCLLMINDSVQLVAQEIILFWRKARIPTQNEDKIRNKIKKLHEKWASLQKNEHKVSETHRLQENVFTDSFNELFDIEHIKMRLS